MAKLLKRMFARGKGRHDEVAAMKDDFVWVYNPAIPYHIQVDGAISSYYGRRSTSCAGGEQSRTPEDNFGRCSAKSAYCAPQCSIEPYCNNESSVYGSAGTSFPEARPSLCCAENSVNERIAVLEAKLQAYRVRLRMEIKKKRRYKEKLLVEREMHQTSENMHLTEIMRLKRDHQNLLIKNYVVEQKYYGF